MVLVETAEPPTARKMLATEEESWHPFFQLKQSARNRSPSPVRNSKKRPLSAVKPRKPGKVLTATRPGSARPSHKIKDRRVRNTSVKKEEQLAEGATIPTQGDNAFIDSNLEWLQAAHAEAISYHHNSTFSEKLQWLNEAQIYSCRREQRLLAALIGAVRENQSLAVSASLKHTEQNRVETQQKIDLLSSKGVLTKYMAETSG